MVTPQGHASLLLLCLPHERRQHAPTSGRGESLKGHHGHDERFCERHDELIRFRNP
jgi:hypothetical protein